MPQFAEAWVGCVTRLVGHASNDALDHRVRGDSPLTRFSW